MVQEVEPAHAHGVVRVIEPLGNVSDIIVDIGAGDIGSVLFTVRIPGFATITPGTHVSVDTSCATVHCFDPDTGRRLN